MLSLVSDVSECGVVIFFVMKRAVWYLAAVLAVALVAGCGGSRTGAPVDGYFGTTPPLPPHGFLVVAIHRGGGVFHRAGLGGGLVSIFNAHGHFIGRLHIKEGHTSKVWLRAGHYSLGLGYRRPTSRRLGGCRPKAATVRVGRTTRYNLWYGCALE